MKELRSDHRVSVQTLTETVREAGRALDSSKNSGHQQGVESKMNEFTEHRCRWLSVVAVEGEKRCGRLGRGDYVGPQICFAIRKHDYI